MCVLTTANGIAKLDSFFNITDIVDEADSLNINGIEQLTGLYDKLNVGMILIGMLGLEKKLSRYRQLYSRIGFSHRYDLLQSKEMRFILSHYWEKLG